jgi:hypothetical protein
MKRVKGGGLREMMKRAGEVESRQDEEVPAIREVPKQEPESPPIATYLDPDAENGRPRIVIMLTEDGERIEHLFYTKMSYVQATSNLSTMLVSSPRSSSCATSSPGPFPRRAMSSIPRRRCR